MRRNLLVLLASASVSVGGCGDATPSPSQKYQVEWSGRGAVTDHRVPLTIIGDEPFGAASAGATCDEVLFLTDLRNRLVHQIRLSDGVRLRALGPGTAAKWLGPETVAVDCAAQMLYVVDHQVLFEFSLATGDLKSQHQLPRSLGPLVGTGIVAAGAVVVPGVFMPNPNSGWMDRVPAKALDGAYLSYKVGVAGDAPGTRTFATASPSCRGMSPDTCMRVAIDFSPAQKLWAVCRSGAPRIELFDNDGRIVRSIDVRSPLFADDGSVMKAPVSIPDRVRWMQKNSMLHTCGFFGDYLATTHVIYEPGEWQPGKALVARTYLNIHRLDGTPLVSDVRLPDRPIARDASALFVVDRSERSVEATSSGFTLTAIRIVGAGGAIAPELMH